MRGFMLVLLLCFCIPAVWGGAFYSTSATSTFAIGGYTVVVGTDLGHTLEIGTGVATSSGVLTPGGTLPASRTVSSSGSTTAPPNSFASSDYMTGHVFTFDNSAGLTPATIAFAFSYSWAVAIGADTPGLDFASGGAFFHITGIDNETLLIGGVPVAEFLFHPVALTSLGEIGTVGAGLTEGFIVVPAGEISVFSVITDTAGSAASSTVPEPSTALLGLLGLAGIGLAHFRRRHRG